MTAEATIHNYEEAAAFLEGGRNRDERPIENNTRVVRKSPTRIAIRLHSTDVVTYGSDGTVELNTGGWFTSTTKDRLNKYVGIKGLGIYSDRGRWIVSRFTPSAGEWHRFEGHPEWDYQEGLHEDIGPFFDGMILRPDGSIANPPPESATIAAEKERRAIERDLRDYLKGFKDALVKGELDVPSGGDCWFCSMFEQAGLHDSGHLREHIAKDERYYVPSLLFNAVQERGYGDWKFVMSMRLDREAYDKGVLKARSDNAANDLIHDVRRYLKKRLLPGGGVTPVGVGITTGAGSGYYGV